MQKKREQEQEELNSIKMLGPALANQAAEMGVNIPSQAREYLGTVAGQNILTEYVKMKQANEELKMRGQQLGMAHNKIMNPWSDPSETMTFVKGLGQVAKDNAPLLAAMKERVGDPAIKAMIDGALQGANQNKGFDEVIEDKIKMALARDDPTARDAALNIQSLAKGGQLREQPVYDGAGKPIVERVLKKDAIAEKDGTYKESEYEDKPKTISAASLLKKDFERLLGPAPAKKPTTQPTTKQAKLPLSGVRSGVVMDDLADLGAPKEVQRKISDFLGQFRLTKSRADLEKAAGVIDSLPAEQQDVIKAEIQKIMTGN
jgi:hypothetical protein